MTIIFIIILFFWILHLSGRITDLEKKLAVKTHIEQAKQKAPEEIHFPSQAEKTPVTQYAAHLTVNSHQAVNVQPVQLENRESKPKETDAQMEAKIATNWLNKVGVVALVLGMTFFFKYAIDQGWINEWARIIIGLLVSGLLVYLGELWKEKFGNRAQALSGGGVALFYFTIYAAYNFYHIFPQPLAFVLMLGVAGLSVFLSFRYSSLVLGVLGFFGAYGSPLLLSSGKNQQVSLFAYLTILNVTALIILVRKYWMELLSLALVGTVIDLLFWAGAFSAKDNTYTTLLFVILTTLLLGVGATALTRYHHQKQSLSQSPEKTLGLFGFLVGLFYFVASVLLLRESFHDLLAPILALGGIIFFFSYALVDRLEYKNTNYLLSFVGAIMLVFAAIYKFHGFNLGLCLLILSLLGSTLGTLLKREELRVWSMFILLVSLFKSLYEPYPVTEHAFLFNAKFGLMLANAGGMLFQSWLYTKITPTQNEKNLDTALQIIAAAVLWVAMSWDISNNFSSQGSLLVGQYTSLWWVLYPAALALIATLGRKKALFNLSLLLLCAGLLKVLLLDYSPGSLFLYNSKFGLMLLMALALLFVAKLYPKVEDKPNDLVDALKVASSLLFWFAVSWDIVKYYELSGSQNARNLFLSLWWIVYAMVLMIAGSLGRAPIFRKVAIGLFGLSILKVFLFDVSALDTAYRIISFIALGVILLGVSFTYQKNKEKIAHFLEGKVESEHK